VTDAELYARSNETLLAAWEEHARGATDAAVRRLPGVGAAVFPREPERSVYNNAVLVGGLAPAERAAALDAMEDAYEQAGVTRFAAWVHETDAAMRSDVERRGYTLAETTRAMGLALDDLRAPRPELELAPPEWSEHLRIAGVPPDFLAGADPRAYHLLLSPLDGENVATALAFDFNGDRGIYNVGTVERARRRGLGTALTAVLLHDARARGCTTATLQSTAAAERIYAALGFRDLGRIFEYAPRPRAPRSRPR
jgi:ribosomal protein S18 acetylase RimI-like enzyme